MSNNRILQEKLTSSIFRYASIFNPSGRYSEFYDKIWLANYIFNPLDPDSGWGTRIHKTVFPLPGNIESIIPEKAKGYLMDSTCDASVLRGNAYSYTPIVKKKGI